MNETRISNLYRRLTGQRPAPAFDADDAVAAAEGLLGADHREAVAEVLARSPAHADLVRMLSALRPDSEALAADVRRLERGRHGHPRRTATDRRATPLRRVSARLSWAAGVAACLVAVLGLWSQRHLGREAHLNAAPQHAFARAGDEIFNSNDSIFNAGMDKHGRPARSDELFRGAFNGG